MGEVAVSTFPGEVLACRAGTQKPHHPFPGGEPVLPVTFPAVREQAWAPAVRASLSTNEKCIAPHSIAATAAARSLV